MTRGLAIGSAPLFGAFLLSLAAGMPAVASEESASMLAWGLDHAECAEWTDLCQVCARAPEGSPQCSTPGIACQPGPVLCRKPADPPPASGK